MAACVLHPGDRCGCPDNLSTMIDWLHLYDAPSSLPHAAALYMCQPASCFSELSGCC